MASDNTLDVKAIFNSSLSIWTLLFPILEQVILYIVGNTYIFTLINMYNEQAL